MNYQESLKRVSDQAFRLYLANSDDRLFYHNLAHTVRFLEDANKIISHYTLDDKNNFIVCTAVWLHDLTFSTGGYGSNETKVNDAVAGFLTSLDIDYEVTAEIINCILATKMSRQPVSLNEKIICDAYSFYIGTVNFSAYHKLIRREIEAFAGHKMKGSEWRANGISLLENHRFHTEYCQSLLNKTKEDNLQAFIRTQEEKQGRGHSDIQPRSPKAKHHLRGVETMFRNSSSNHQRLSVMADNKAFIMISVNSILISVAIGLIIGKFVLIPKLFVPTVLLLSVNVITIIYSVLATRPGVMKGTFTRKELEDKTVDLLFFGSFYKMPLEEFAYGMKRMMDDSEFLYGSLIRDIYLQGKILGRKFRFLRISYNIFMYGTACTVLAYIISFFF
jgi:predicted metal-dependent HD superfamily phosphohydrolase